MNLIRKEVRLAKRRWKWILISLAFISNSYFVIYEFTFHKNIYVYPGLYIGDKCKAIGNGIITTFGKGRLGNNILEYVSVLTCAEIYGLQVYIPREIMQRLEGLFENMSRPEKEANVSLCQWKYGDEFDDITWELMNLKRKPSLRDAVGIAKNCSRAIVLSKSIILVETVYRFVPKFRTQFQYRRHFREAAQSILTSIKNKIIRVKGIKVVFVGVHIRRTDYVEHYRLCYNGTAMAGVDYYIRAAVWMFQKLSADAEGRLVDVVFVVVSDDPKWCTQILIPEMQMVSRGDFEVVYGVGSVQSSPENDLALLSACNHSIIDYGTFGLWAAIMVGGRTIVYNVTWTKDNTRLSPAMRFAELLGNWVVME